MGPLSRNVMGLDPDDRYEPMPRCDQCDRTIWCDEVHHEGYVFCSAECRDAGSVDDNVARTETGAPGDTDLLPAHATASRGTREPYVASVPPSTPARRPNSEAVCSGLTASHGADLSRLVSWPFSESAP